MYEFVSIVILIFGVLQIILFFKMWSMTNNVSSILEILNNWENKEKLPKAAKVKNNGLELDVLGMKNGKILCRQKGLPPLPSNETLYYFDELDFS